MSLTGVNLDLPGYDNLFLVGGFNWTAKMVKLHPINFIQLAMDHAERFDKLNKYDLIKVGLWANEFRHMCSEPGRPLPIIEGSISIPIAKSPLKVKKIK